MKRNKAKRLKQTQSIETRPTNFKKLGVDQSVKRLNSVKLNELKQTKTAISANEELRTKKTSTTNTTNSFEKNQGLDYHIIGSGSSGNCVRIENVMIDIGLPYKHIKEDLYKTDVILITHTHTDHIKQTVFNRIRKEFPDITIVGNHQVATEYDVDFICYEGTPFEVKGIEFTPFLGKHNVLCYGYIWQDKGYDIIYCTDSSDFDNSPDDSRYPKAKYVQEIRIQCI